MFRYVPTATVCATLLLHKRAAVTDSLDVLDLPTLTRACDLLFLLSDLLLLIYNSRSSDF